MATVANILFDLMGGYFTNKGHGIGFRERIDCGTVLGAIVKTHDAEDPRIFELWEDLRWKEHKKWILEMSKKYNLQYQTAGHFRD